jgi:hypothetical protein
MGFGGVCGMVEQLGHGRQPDELGQHHAYTFGFVLKFCHFINLGGQKGRKRPLSRGNVHGFTQNDSTYLPNS